MPSLNIVFVPVLVALVAFGAAGQAQERDARDPRVAEFTGRLSVNSTHGPKLGLGVKLNRLFGRDQQLRFGAEVTRDTRSYNLSYAANGLFGENPRFGLTASAVQSSAKEGFNFDSASARIQPRLTWQLGEGRTLGAYLGLSTGDISNVSATTSQLIRADSGTRQRQNIGIDMNWRRSATGPNRPALRFGFATEYGGDDRGHRYASVSARSAAIWRPRADSGLILRAQLRAGTIQSLEGTSHIGDRYVLGQNSIRGFSFGGFGPRDLAVVDQPALGGNSFAVARFDAQFNDAFGEDARLKPGLFVDVGSLWGLDDTAGGVAGANQVDDTLNLRGSVGISVQVDTGIGALVLNVAQPVLSKSYDNPQLVQFSFRRTF